MKMKCNSVIVKFLSMFGTTWVCKSFSIVSFMKSKCRSGISSENLESELKCVVSVKDKLNI